MKKLLIPFILIGFTSLTGCVSTKTTKSPLILDFKPELHIETDSLGSKSCRMRLIAINKSNRTATFNIKATVFLYDEDTGNQLGEKKNVRIEAYKLPNNSSYVSPLIYVDPFKVCETVPIKYRVTYEER